jgi:thiol-disulfide isomerase/thioredoxin
MRRSLYPIVLITCGFVFIPLLHRLFPPELPAPQFVVYNPPRQLADFSFSDGSTQILTLNRFRGRFLLVNVWATWCSPCKDEMASLNHLAALSAATDLEVIPISIDVSGASLVRSFYNRLGLDRLPIYVDPSKKVMDALSIVGIPTTLLIDRSGREIGRVTGAAQWDAAESVKRISEIIGR